MLKIGFFTDLHLRGQGFSSRKDDYVEAVLNKLQFCLERCSRECDFIVFGGDFTDTHRLVSDTVKERALLLLNNYLSNDVPFFFTYGQHDLYGHNYGTRNDSTTSLLMRLALMLGKQVYELPRDEFLEVETGKERFVVSLTACPSGDDPVIWSYETHERALKANPCNLRVGVVHHLLSDQKADWFVPFENFFTGTAEFRSLDVVLCGDLHDGFEPYVNEVGTLFLNPGSLARTKKTKRDLERTIQGTDVLVSLNDEKQVSYEHQTWSVETAQSGTEVFREEHPFLEEVEALEAETGKCNDIEDFNEVVQRLAGLNRKQVDVWDLLERKARENGLDHDVWSYLMTKRQDN